MAKLEEPDNEVYGYLAREAADRLGEYISLSFGEGAEATLQKTTSNYGVYETPGGAVVGLGIRKSILEGLDGEDVPETINIKFAASSEDEWDEADSVDEEEVSALVAD